MNIVKNIKISLLSTIAFVPLATTVPVDIVTTAPVSTPTPTPTPTATIKVNKLNKEMFNKIQVKVFTGKRAWVKEGTVVSLAENSFTLSEGGVAYTVAVDGGTLYKRKFGGKSDFSEIAVNDVVNVLGKWGNEEKTAILATHIRNLSVQKKHATFFGTVKSVGEKSLVISTRSRGDQTIVIVETTKLVNRKMEEIKLTEIEVGHKIRIKGLWDKANNKVSEVTQIKDFTVPVILPPTHKPTE